MQKVKVKPSQIMVQYIKKINKFKKSILLCRKYEEKGGRKKRREIVNIPCYNDSITFNSLDKFVLFWFHLSVNAVHCPMFHSIEANKQPGKRAIKDTAQTENKKTD